MPRAARNDWRAPVLLLYVVAGASLIVRALEPIVGLLAGPAPTELAFEICARLGIGLAIIVLALVGLVALGRDAVPRAGGTLATVLAFPAGAGALALALAAAWAGGVAVARPAALAEVGMFALGTGLILLAVVAEELLLRGLLQPVLVRAWGPAAGVLVCSLAFMVIHMVGGWGHPLSLLNILLAGIWFGLLALRSGGLAAPILAHFGYNWTEEMIFGATPNPGVGAFGAAFDIDLIGAAMWGGSAEGLNTSLVVSAVLTALILPLALRRGRRTSSDGAKTRS